MPSNKKGYRKAYYEANKEKAKAYDKSWRENNRDKMKVYSKAYNKAYREVNKEKEKEYRKEYNQANKEKLSAYHKAWYEDNKEKIKTQNKAWKEANKGKVNAGVQAYQTKKKERNYITSSEDKQMAEWVYIMRSKLTETTDIVWHVDHIKPLSKGGKHSLNNLQIVPATWNLQKNNNNEERWNGKD